MTPAKLAQLRAAAKAAPAPSPAAWLDQMAPDAGRAHVLRLGELCEQLRAQGSERDYAPLQQALGQLAQALPQLDFGLLQPKGWLARATGKARSAGAEFAAQHERIVETARSLKEQAQSLQKKAQSETSATERTLVEFDVECAAIEKIIDQGARWLQDIRADLKARGEAAPDEAAQRQIDEDAARSEVMEERFDVLRGLAAGSRDALRRAQEAAARRTALQQLAQQLLTTQYKAWEGRVAPLAAAAGDSGSPALDLVGPAEVHKDLQQRIAQAVADCGQVEAQEQALAQQLAGLREQLRSAA